MNALMGSGDARSEASQEKWRWGDLGDGDGGDRFGWGRGRWSDDVKVDKVREDTTNLKI